MQTQARQGGTRVAPPVYIESVMTSWPFDFIQRMSTWLGPEAADFLQALAQRDVGLRLNTLRGAASELAARLPWPVEEVPWCVEGRVVRSGEPGSHPYHAAGVYYLQDPSTMAAAEILDPRPGEWVLDLAAAPGGKASHLAARMQGQGVLVANDIARKRTSVLAMNLERMGVTNALITNETPERLAERWPGLFDAVLVDAPCSGEGMFSRDPQAVRDWSVSVVQGNARRQLQILEQAAHLVRPGGRMLYATCTFAPEEDEGVIAAFLERCPDFELRPVAPRAGFGPGRPEWIQAPETLRAAVRLFPHRGPGHGHFYALLVRRGSADPAPDPWRGRDVPGRVLTLYRAALAQALRLPAPEAGLVFIPGADQLYLTPMPPELWQDLHVLRPGWWVGTLRHGEVNPEHALALGIAPEAALERLDLALDDPRLGQFLAGASWSDTGPARFVLVTVEGFALGWAKRSGGKLRSRYPVHLRMLTSVE